MTYYAEKKSNTIISFPQHQVVGLADFEHLKYKPQQKPEMAHLHKTIMEIHYVLKGRRTFLLNGKQRGENHKYELCGNQFIVFFPGERHNSGFSAQISGEGYILQIDLKDPTQLLGLNEIYSRLLYTRLSEMRGRVFSVNDKTIRQLKRAFQCICENSPQSVCRGVQHLNCLLFEQGTIPQKKCNEEKKPNAKLALALEHLENHLQDPIQLKDLAQAAGYSLSRFKSCFREEMGITPAEYVMQKKLQIACSVLEEEETASTQIAEMLGFSSSNYFCSVFKKKYGCTPSEYRRRSQFVPREE